MKKRSRMILVDASVPARERARASRDTAVRLQAEQTYPSVLNERASASAGQDFERHRGFGCLLLVFDATKYEFSVVLLTCFPFSRHYMSCSSVTITSRRRSRGIAAAERHLRVRALRPGAGRPLGQNLHSSSQSPLSFGADTVSFLWPLFLDLTEITD